MKLRIFLYTSLTCLLGAGAARGQALPGSGADVSIGYQGLPAKAMGTTVGGVQISDSALLHMGIGAEGGYDSNVFYSENDPKGSPILRVVPFVELTNANRGGSASSANVFFDLGAALTYREYLSDDPLIREQRALMPSVFGNLEFGRIQAVGVSITDGFTRTEDPPYLNVPDSPPIIRDINMAAISARWAPGGGRLAATLRYMNTIDAFETAGLRVANSMANLLTLDLSWKWLPKTALVVQLSQGYTFYFNTNAAGESKPTSFPLHAMAGVRGLVTAKLSINVLLGYSNGFYDAIQPGPTGFRGNFSAQAEANYRPTLLSTVVLGYRHDFQNAILGDFYYVDSAYLNIGHAIAGRLGIGLTARYESRLFQNIRLSDGTYIGRHDNFVQGGANLDYHLRDWTYIGLAYIAMSNSSDYSPRAADDPGRVNYFKQLVFARLGVTY